MIYELALYTEDWTIAEFEDTKDLLFPAALGDFSGFYFPLSNAAILRVNQQIRHDSLIAAYRSTIFRLDDMDDLIKLLLAIGTLGRNNIQSLEFPWQSRTDLECRWDQISDPDEYFFTLPALHVSTCVKLLMQCEKLKHLRLKFEEEVISTVRPQTFQHDVGIQGLSRIGGLQKLEIFSLADEPINHLENARWLKDRMERLGDRMDV